MQRGIRILSALVVFAVVGITGCLSDSTPESREAESVGLTALTFTGSVTDPTQFTFMAAGDTHIGGGNTSRLQGILQDGTTRGHAFLTLLGDIVDRGDSGSYVAIDDQITALGWTGKFFPILGNHDIVKSTWTEYKGRYGPNYYTFDVGNSRFIALDTADGVIGSAQWDWLKNELAKTRPTNTFILTHYLPVVPQINTYLKMSSAEEASRFMALCIERGVTAVLGGHYHSFTQSRIEGTYFVAAGVGGGRPMEPVQDRGYIEVSVQGSEVSFTFRGIP